MPLFPNFAYVSVFVFVYEVDQLCFLVLKQWPYVGCLVGLNGIVSVVTRAKCSRGICCMHWQVGLVLDPLSARPGHGPIIQLFFL